MTPADERSAMPVTTQEADLAKDSILGDRFMLRFSEDTLRHRPLWIRLIIEFLGTFILVTVAAGAGVINHYVGTDPISRTAAVIAPGAVVMAMIYALGPLSASTSTPPSPSPSPAGRVFRRPGCCPTWWSSWPAPSLPPCSSRPCSATVHGRQLSDHQARRATGTRWSWRSCSPPFW